MKNDTDDLTQAKQAAEGNIEEPPHIPDDHFDSMDKPNHKFYALTPEAAKKYGFPLRPEKET
jgi:hypothetical protein